MPFFTEPTVSKHWREHKAKLPSPVQSVNDCLMLVVGEQILALIQEPLRDQRSQVVTVPLQSLLTVHRKSLPPMSDRLLVTSNSRAMNRRRWVACPRSTQELSRELHLGVGSHCWRPRPWSRGQVPTARLLAMPKKGCVVMEENRWWTVQLMFCGLLMKPPKIITAAQTTVAYQTWLTSTSLLRPSYRKMVSAVPYHLYCCIIMITPVGVLLWAVTVSLVNWQFIKMVTMVIWWSSLRHWSGSFCAAAPSVWNSVPTEVWLLFLHSTFKDDCSLLTSYGRPA